MSNSDVSRLGGKGAGLVWLSQNTDLGFEVPEFEVVDTSYYEEWQRQLGIAKLAAILKSKASGNREFVNVPFPRRLEVKCVELAQRFEGREVAVRSSAVVSEDSEKHSGAGMYDSVFFERWDDEKFNLDSLKRAILQVYSSVDNPRATKYRKQAGLKDEKMAVVVQEIAKELNGVVMSRLPFRDKIVPVSWSSARGAVVGGDKEAEVYTAYFSKYDFATSHDSGPFQCIFRSENLEWESKTETISESLVPLVRQLRKRYGKEVDVEFVMDLSSNYNPLQKFNPHIKLLQIRPITNISDKQVKFPRKKPILQGGYSVGVGEYIGPWVRPLNDVRPGWNEPDHYVYVASTFERILTGHGQRHDYDELTPNKRAIVLAGRGAPDSPGTHALTIAHEKGILCLIGKADYNKLRTEGDGEMEKKYGSMGALMMEAEFGAVLTKPLEFDVPIQKVGPYIHVVCDGLKSRVYRATREEAVEFARRNGLSIPR